MSRRNQKQRVGVVGVVGVGLLAMAGGCSRQSNPDPAVATPEEAVPSMEAAFQEAPAETQQEAQEAVNAIQSQDNGAAYLRLESLSQKQTLTPEQRQAMLDAWMAVNRRLAESAANGDAAAEELLNRYRSSK